MSARSWRRSGAQACRVARSLAITLRPAAGLPYVNLGLLLEQHNRLADLAALAPADQQARHDNHEATEALWLRPREGLSRYWDGAIDLAPPQIMTLMELARFARAADALAYAAARAVPVIEPEPFDEDGTRTICYPGDERHSLRTPAWVGPSRLSYRNRRFEPRGGLADLLVGAL